MTLKSPNPKTPFFKAALTPFLQRNWRISLSLFLLVGGLALWVYMYAYSFLAFSKPLSHPDACIVEGWLPFPALQTLSEVCLLDSSMEVIVTGASLGHKYITLGEYPEAAWTSSLDTLAAPPGVVDSISVWAWGNSPQQVFGIIRIEVNDHIAGKLTVSPKSRRYVVANPLGSSEPIQKVTIGMENSHFPQNAGDIRRVYLEQIRVGTLNLPLFSPYARFSFAFSPLGRLEASHADNSAIVAGSILEKLGIPKTRLKLLPYEAPTGARTLQGAKEVASWVGASSRGIKSLHLYSQATHARRSYEIYRKYLPDSIQLGVSALEDYRYDEYWMYSPEGRALVLEQLAKYLYYKIVFIR